MMDSDIPIEKRLQILAKIAVFSALKPSALAELGGLLAEKRTRSQEAVFRKGDEGHELFILVEGEVRVHDGNHVIARLHEGDVFGEYALIDKEKRSASVTTEKPCLFLVLSREKLIPFMSGNPELLVGLLHTQVKRMRDMNELEDKLSKSYLKISRQKQEIEAQNEAIKEQKNQLEQQNASLVEMNEYKRQLMSVLIHGLKNPLTSAMMMTDLLAQPKLNQADQAQYVAVLKQSLKRMDEVFNGIIAGNQKEAME